MYLYKIGLTLLVYILSLAMLGQIERGALGKMDQLDLAPFYNEEYLDLSHLRTTTNFLTDLNHVLIGKDTIPKRKKAFVRHIKHINEKLEYDYFNLVKRNNQQEEMIYELLLFKASLEQKTIENAHPKIKFKQKVKMVVHTHTSKQRLKVKIPKIHIPIDTIVNSPYWHEPEKNRPIYTQFGYLAKQKKIKAKPEMVVLYKNLSLSGSAPKIDTYDVDLDNQWTLKWGDEIHTDIVGSRIFAALGYDVDHPYYYEKEALTLIFDDYSIVKNKNELVEELFKIYKIDLAPFISDFGIVTPEMLLKNKTLSPYLGKQFVQFRKCAIEGRPDRVKRIGSFLPDLNEDRVELRAALLAHEFIGNWDTREENTLLTTVHNGNYEYRMSAVFSDLGTSLGVHNNYLPVDFKVGLVNKLPWEVVKRKGNKIVFTNRINAMLSPYKKATYEELKWMAKRIALLDQEALEKIVKKAHWPEPIETLYFNKLASRRASILKAFEIEDPTPIEFDKNLTIENEGEIIIKNGDLIVDYKPKKNPESFYLKKGRLRNYGN